MEIDWDSALYILLVTALTTSPALLAIPWIWFTKSPKVRCILRFVLLAAITVPVASAGLFALATGLCDQGHIDQQFAECGWIPSAVSGYGSLSLWYLFVALPPLLGLVCVWIEFRHWRNG